MALSFPLTLDDFFDRWPKYPYRVTPTDPIITSRTRGGEVWTAQVGNVLWQGAAEFHTLKHADAEAAGALLKLLRRPGASFFARPWRCGPAADPDGTILGASSVTIRLIDGSRREIGLEGFPTEYVLSSGDYFGVSYGSSPTRHLLHQVITGGVAGGLGHINNIEITPPLPAPVMTSTAVALIKPVFKAVLTDAPDYGVAKSGVRFSFVQTLGA